VGTQPALAVWRSLFFEPSPFQVDKSQSSEWNRGAYLVQGLGHCAACHSPRNALGASGAVNDLSGGLMPVVNWYAPNLTQDAESGLASTPLPEIVRLLRTGASDTAQTNGPMGEVVQHSLQHLKEADLLAMAVYLQSRAQGTTQPGPLQYTGPAFDWGCPTLLYAATIVLMLVLLTLGGCGGGSDLLDAEEAAAAQPPTTQPVDCATTPQVCR
jgi:mono/diheme cytochrome c family protein